MDKAMMWKVFLYAMVIIWFAGGINYLMKDDLVGAAIYLCAAGIWLFMALFGKLGVKK